MRISDWSSDVCSSDLVDTPELRAMKADSEIADCEPGTGEHVDGGLPEVTLPCLGGGDPVDLSTLRGPMVVNLWAAWCGPCRREMPRSEEHTSELQSLMRISYAVFCLKKKNIPT